MSATAYASAGNNLVFGNNVVSVLARPITEITITMSIFTSEEFFTSFCITYRVGNVIISIVPKGDDRRSYSRWEMKYFIGENQHKNSEYRFLPKFRWRTVIFHHEKHHISANIAPPIISFRDYTNDYILYTMGDTKGSEKFFRGENWHGAFLEFGDLAIKIQLLIFFESTIR